MELLKGQTLGDYAVLKEIGHGGVGRVYEVEHTITRRREAIKVMSFEGVGETERSERFLREIRLQAALNHPNIASVHNAFWTDDTFILVSELLEGEPLQAVIARGKLSVERSLEIIRQVLAALRCAHARGIMHRDISPANIFVTSAGPVKLIDFGLAKASTDLNLTQAGLAVGSFYYTSPEQIRAEPTVDLRTDLYSCGAVLYEMLTGRKPFEGTAFEVMQAHCERVAERPSAIDASIPGVVSDLVMKALAKKADARFGSAEEFLRGLEGITVVAANPAAKARITPWVLVASAALAVGVWFVVLRPSPPAVAAPVVPSAVPQVIAPVAVTPAPVAAPIVTEPVKPMMKPRVTQAVSKPLLTDELTPPVAESSAALVDAPVEPVVTNTPQPQPPSHGVMGAVKKLNVFKRKKN
jgi:serine/threonine-protein kinase